MEVAMTTFVINIRYMLMSLSISQRLEQTMGTWKRMIYGFIITDETFVVASMNKGILRAAYLFGLMILPIFGWNIGTLLGACISNVLPAELQSAMGIALYGMFIALLVPAARDSMHVFVIILIAVVTNCILKFVPLFSFISSGFRIILATFVGAGVGAWMFPKEEEV